MAKQGSGILGTTHLLAQDSGHGGLGPMGHHLDGGDEVLALRLQAVQTMFGGQLAGLDVLGDFSPLPLDLVVLPIKLRYQLEQFTLLVMEPGQRGSVRVVRHGGRCKLRPPAEKFS